jgi:uncharacterized coiled-coil protein SlyX
MKIRKIIFSTALSAFVCFGLSPQTQADDPVPPSNTADGQNALLGITSGLYNSAFGFDSLLSNGAANFNTGVGAGTLLSNTGSSNTAVGAGALLFNDNDDNTAIGAFALFNNTADSNTAIGSNALLSNTTGGTLENIGGLFDVGPNTALGSFALASNIDSSANTAVGYQALGSVVHGDVAQGFPHLGVNTAVGFQALANLNGDAIGGDTAFGYQALFDLTDGFSNLAIGILAGIGLTSGDGNIYIGAGVGAGAASESDHTYIGNIDTTTVTDDPVYVDLTTGLLGHLSSSRRYKQDIKPMDNASERLYRLKPVTYRYNKEIDRNQALDYGLIAEDVAKVDPNLAVRNKKGQIESVRYTAINAMLLNEFLKEHEKVEAQGQTVQEQQATIAELKSTVAQQQKGMEALTAQLKEQAAQIQKVSAQLEVSKPTAKTVANK